MAEHDGRLGVIKLAAAPLGVARHAEHVEGKAVPAGARENIDGTVDVARPDIVGNVASDIEDAARNCEVGNVERFGTDPPLAIVGLTVKLARLFDHGRRDVVTGETAAIAFGAQKTQEVAKTAAEIDDGSVRVPVQQPEKLPVAPFLRFDSVPVDALRGRTMRRELCGVVRSDPRQQLRLSVAHRCALVSGRAPCTLMTFGAELATVSARWMRRTIVYGLRLVSAMILAR